MSPAPSALVVAEDPTRARLREVQARLEARRDEIAALDLEIETLREALAAFEAGAHAQLEVENRRLTRLRGLIDHLDRWTRLLRERSRDRLLTRARRVEVRRAREVLREAQVTPEPEPVEMPPVVAELPRAPEAADELKSLYRALARRFHPDLARTEEERVRFGGIMTRINALYAERDLERLRALAEQQKGGEVEDVQESVELQLQRLLERLAWFDRVLENLQDERAELEKFPTCVLMRRAEQAQAQGRDVFAELRNELREEYEGSLKDVTAAARRLEGEVERFNRDALKTAIEVKGKGSTSLERLFDPFANKKLVRTGLSALRAASASPAAKEKAKWLETLAEENRPLLRLLLFAYAGDLSPQSLPGLEKLEEIKARYDYVCREAPSVHPERSRGASLEAVLADAVGWVEYGVRSGTEQRVRTGLRFRDETVRQALPLALRSLAVKEEFRRVLEALGDKSKCDGCGQTVYAVPLFRTRGLDDLRAAVCPSCGHTMRSYWMPRGDDVQSVLNDAFVELEMVTEWSFRIARASIAIQLLPIQVEAMTVGDLKARFHKDVLEKNGVEVSLAQVSLVQGKTAVKEKTPLAELEEQAFSVKLQKGAKVTAAEALELVRYRIRNRFKPDAPKPS